MAVKPLEVELKDGLSGRRLVGLRGSQASRGPAAGRRLQGAVLPRLSAERGQAHQAGAPTLWVSEMLGHSDVRVALGIYGHLTQSMRAEAAAAVAHLRRRV